MKLPKNLDLKRKISIKIKRFISTGTPFRALNNGEFLEDQIFTWSYRRQEQKTIGIVN